MSRKRMSHELIRFPVLFAVLIDATEEATRCCPEMSTRMSGRASRMLTISCRTVFRGQDKITLKPVVNHLGSQELQGSHWRSFHQCSGTCP